MKELEKLKELYLDEIKKINKKEELTPADAEAAKIALEAIEKIEIICDSEEMGYSERSYMRRSYTNRPYYYGRDEYYVPDHMYRRSMMPEMEYEYDRYDDYSNRRGRSENTGRYISRSSDTVNSMIKKLEGMLHDSPDEETRSAIECAISKLEQGKQ